VSTPAALLSTVRHAGDLDYRLVVVAIAAPIHAKQAAVVTTAELASALSSPTFPTGALILEFCRRKLNLFKGR
jgi:hypothetical protein